MIGRQAAKVQALAIAVDVQHRRRAHARRDLQQQRQRFFANPANLLWPFTAGALLAASVRVRPARGHRPARGVTLGSLLRTAVGLWSATSALRQPAVGSTASAASGAPHEA